MPPQKTTRGAKQKKKQEDTKKRVLVTKEEDPCLEYATILKIYSTERVDVRCLDQKTRHGVISGQMRKKIYVQPGDLVLVSKRDYQDSKCDISLKYFPHEVQQLVKLKHIPSNFCNLEQEKGDSNIENILQFTDESDDEERPDNGGRDYNLPPSDSEEDENQEEQKQGEEQQEQQEEQEKEVETYAYQKTNKIAKDKRQKQQNQKKGDDSDSDVDIDDL